MPEGLRIEYKVSSYGYSDSDKREFLKDVSAFANAQGGHLLIGVDEVGGVATTLVGLPGIDIDSEVRRLEQIAHTGLEPRIIGLRIRPIALASGENVVAVRVPRSWNPPHRIVAGNSNRFWVRDTAGAHEPDVEELRVLFSEYTSAIEKARTVRDSRLSEIDSGHAGIHFRGYGRFFLHIIPVSSLSGAAVYSVEELHSQARCFPPIGADYSNPMFNFHGFYAQLVESDGAVTSHIQVFRNGVIECVFADFVRESDGRCLVPSVSFECEILEALPKYIDGLRAVGVPPPFVITMAMKKVAGATYAVPSDYGPRLSRPFPEGDLVLPECLLEDYGDVSDRQRVVRPAFDAIWNSIGYPKSEYYDDEDRWVGNH